MVRQRDRAPEFWLENNGEGMFLYVKVEPFLAQLARAGSRPPSGTPSGSPRSAEGGRSTIGSRPGSRSWRLRGSEECARHRRRRPRLRRLIVDTETPIFEAWLGAYRRRGCSVGLDEWQHALGTHGGFEPLDHLEAQVQALRPGQALDRDAVLAR